MQALAVFIKTVLAFHGINVDDTLKGFRSAMESLVSAIIKAVARILMLVNPEIGKAFIDGANKAASGEGLPGGEQRRTRARRTRARSQPRKDRPGPRQFPAASRALVSMARRSQPEPQPNPGPAP